MVVYVVAQPGETWAVTDEDMVENEDRSYPTQEQAIEAARGLLKASGGGEIVVHGADGELREKEIIGVVDTATLDG